MAHMTEELVTSGRLERVNVSVEASSTMHRAVRPWEGARRALEWMSELGLVTDDEIAAISQRIGNRFPPSD